VESADHSEKVGVPCGGAHLTPNPITVIQPKKFCVIFPGKIQANLFFIQPGLFQNRNSGLDCGGSQNRTPTKFQLGLNFRETEMKLSKAVIFLATAFALLPFASFANAQQYPPVWTDRSRR
jgi:hypothetical protein